MPSGKVWFSHLNWANATLENALSINTMASDLMMLTFCFNGLNCEVFIADQGHKYRFLSSKIDVKSFANRDLVINRTGLKFIDLLSEISYYLFDFVIHA